MKLPDCGELFLGKYRLDKVLGEGGFARVFRAEEIALGRTVALKVLKPDGEAYPPGTEARFNREVRIIANLNDPHTVTVYDWGRTDDGLMFMVFEFVDGEDLSALLKRVGTLDEPSILHILRQMLHSLREAHAAHLLHRDIKPQNIRIYAYGDDSLRAKLLDFGIARPLEGADAVLTQKGILIGSPRYMSPEQLFDRELSPASDIYSLGLVTYEMLLGRAALGANNFHAQLERLADPNALSIPAQAPASPLLRSILAGMLARELPDRFQSAAEVLAALNARPTASDLRPTRPVAGPTEAVPVQPPRNWAAWIALSVLVVLACAGGAAMLLQPPPPPPRTATFIPQPAPAPPHPVPPEVAQGAPDASSDQPADLGVSGSAGCGAKPPFVGTGTLSGLDGLRRASWLTYVPAAYDPNVVHPVLVLFHEDSEKPAEFLARTQFARYADERGFVIVAPYDESLRAWRGMSEVEVARNAVQSTAKQLCLDTSAVFAFGHGTGGRAVERLHCIMKVRAAAASAHRMEADDEFCQPAPPEPYLLIAPMSDGYDPVKGGARCGASKVPLAEMEQRWRDRDHCSSKRTVWDRKSGSTCYTWDCAEEPFVSCHVRGGHRWPGQKERPVDFQNCDGPPMKFPIADTVWKFFDSISG